MDWETLREIADDPRGCGDLNEDAFYAHGDMGGGGELEAWTWLLGAHTFGEHNFTLEAPARQMRVINLRSSLYRGEAVTDVIEIPADHPLARLSDKPVLLDHIGSRNYTAYGFAEETRLRGPNRRITEDIARAIAPYLPIPILFTHSDMPMVDKNERGALLDWSGYFGKKADLRYEPTPFSEDFGLAFSYRYHGNDHWIIPPLAEMHHKGNGKVASLKKLRMPASTMLVEQTVGISWITRSVYVSPVDALVDRLEELVKAGVEPVKKASYHGMSKERVEAMKLLEDLAEGEAE